VFKVQAPRLPPPPVAREVREGEPQPVASGNKPAPAAQPKTSILQKPAGAVPDIQKIGRNDPCYCGSGKKFKKCHGA
jgi:preprotein translocase subunit SecA